MPLVLLLLLHTLVFPLLAFPPLPSLGPWFLDSSVTDHITSNKSLFSTLSTFGHLPSITLANGSQT